MTVLSIASWSLAGLAAAWGADALLRRQRRWRQIEVALASWRAATPLDRRREFEAGATANPTSAAHHFLCGCACLRSGDVAAAARAFGAAHHADYRLESAALLTFACLKASVDGAARDELRRKVSETWEEMRRPHLGADRIERSLLEGLARDSSRPPEARSELPSAIDPAVLLDLVIGLPARAAARTTIP